MLWSTRGRIWICSSISIDHLHVCIPSQEFKTAGSSNTDTSKVNGNLETKYKWSEYGLTFTEKWNTDNTLGTEITVEDQVECGSPQNGFTLCFFKNKNCVSLELWDIHCTFFIYLFFIDY